MPDRYLLAVLLPISLNHFGYQPFRFVGVTFTSDILTMVISIILVTAINYLISKLIVFRKDKPSAEKSDDAESAFDLIQNF